MRIMISHIFDGSIGTGTPVVGLPRPKPVCCVTWFQCLDFSLKKHVQMGPNSFWWNYFSVASILCSQHFSLITDLTALQCWGSHWNPCRVQRTETILIAFKDAVSNGVPVLAHGACRESKLRRCFFRLRRHLGPETAELQILMFLLNFIRQSGICQVESRLVCIPAIGAPPGRTTWKPSQRWMFPTWNTMRSEFGSSLESKTCSSKNSVVFLECNMDPEDTLKFGRRMFVSCRIHKGFGHLHLRLTLYVTWPCH